MTSRHPLWAQKLLMVWQDMLVSILKMKSLGPECPRLLSSWKCLDQQEFGTNCWSWNDMLQCLELWNGLPLIYCHLEWSIRLWKDLPLIVISSWEMACPWWDNLRTLLKFSWCQVLPCKRNCLFQNGNFNAMIMQTLKSNHLLKWYYGIQWVNPDEDAKVILEFKMWKMMW